MADPERLRAERTRLEQLAAASSIFIVEAHGDPPDRYTFTFHGRGLAPNVTSHGEVKVVEEHQCDVRLSYSFPERPPDVRFTTPLFHPNVSFSGYVNVRDLDLHWRPELGLDVLAERLWDLVRWAYMRTEGSPASYPAKSWLEKNPEYELPVDSRPLRDKHAPTATNIVRYERRGPGGSTEVPAAVPRAAQRDVLFIGEDTPAPPEPAVPPRPRRVMPRRRPPADGDDDILFIGDE